MFTLPMPFKTITSAVCRASDVNMLKLSKIPLHSFLFCANGKAMQTQLCTHQRVSIGFLLVETCVPEWPSAGHRTQLQTTQVPGSLHFNEHSLKGPFLITRMALLFIVCFFIILFYFILDLQFRTESGCQRRPSYPNACTITFLVCKNAHTFQH